MTASAMTQDVEKAQEAGMNGHVAKPIDTKELFSTLVKWIEPGEREVPEKISEEEENAVTDGVESKGVDEGILPDNLPGVNIEKGLKTVIGNEKLYRKLLGQFYESNRDVVPEIKKTLEAEDLVTAARLAHTTKGVAGNLGAGELFAAAADLENAIKAEEMDGLEGLIDNFETHLDVVMGGIQELEDRDTAANQADTPAGELIIDIDAVKPLLIEMAELLESDLMGAMSRLETLEQHLGNSRVREDFSQLTKHIDGFDTDGAKESLSKIAEKLDISL
jgi:two-component system sensor histidine kinase/response regulator